MKLVKIFSDGPFKNVKFNEGYNVVLATIHDKKNKKDTHNGLQYILSLIDSDIPKNVEESNQEFPIDSVCLNLNDLNDSGKLFERSF